MKFSLEWLKEYVDAGMAAPDVGTRLTGIGFPPDGLETIGDDTVFDLDVASNRPDCMNHMGLARELAVATDRPLREPPTVCAESTDRPAEKLAAIELEAPDLCGRYTARVITGVRVGASPDWLSRRLAAIGLHPINSVVDATNYVLWEMGHPLHAFDLARLRGRRIRVRRARAGEPLITLDGVQRKLGPETLVIADAERAVAIAGVMGGLDSEISPSTTEVLLESAHFDPIAVRSAARAQGLHTDASHRFERGADVEMTRRAADRCAQVIAEIAGGRIAAGALDRRVSPPFTRRVPLRPERVQRLLGLPVSQEIMLRILERLGCAVERADPSTWQVTIPSFRGDLVVEEDLVEEIARHHGYEKIPSTLPRVLVFPEGRSETERRLHRAREAMVRSGFSEAVNLSIVSAPENESLGRAGPGVRVTNPLAEGIDRLRTTLLPGLLRNLSHNLNHSAPVVRLFEIGNLFRIPPSTTPRPPEEEMTLSLVCGGRGAEKHWSTAAHAPDLFDLKGAVDLLARSLRIPSFRWRSADRGFLVAGSGVQALVGDESVGFAGEAAPAVTAPYGIEGAAFVAEISLPGLFGALEEDATPRYRPLPRTPPVSRDLALILEERITYAEVEEAIRSVEGAPITRVTLFDRYQGKPVPPGKVSLAVNLVFQTPERTLVSSEIKEILDRIIQRLRDRLGAVPRGI